MCIHNEQALIKKCACGYDPKKNRQKEDCTETKALLNHLTFPSLKTSEANRSDKRHMAALLEIISDVFVSWCNQCFARNCYGEVFKLQFFDCTTSFICIFHAFAGGYLCHCPNCYRETILWRSSWNFFHILGNNRNSCSIVCAKAKAFMDSFNRYFSRTSASFRSTLRKPSWNVAS